MSHFGCFLRVSRVGEPAGHGRAVRERKINTMIGNNTNRWDSARESYIFYVSLAIVIGMAVFGLVNDIAARQ